MTGIQFKRMVRGFAVVIAVLGITSARVEAADGAAVLEARQSVNAGKYQDALKTISQALTTSRPTDSSGDRYELLMLRGECLIQIGQRPGAATTFDMALKSAPDSRTASIARANALLVRASPSGKYIPKTSGEQPIDIANPDSRKLAFAALREDLRKAIGPRLRGALSGATLAPMLEVLPSLLDLAYLESVSEGTIEKTAQDLVQLGGRARELMQSELRRIGHEVNSLEAASNSYEIIGRRGLTSIERNAMSDNADYVRQIAQTARNARQRAQELGYDGAPWEPIIADSADLADRIQAMLGVNP